MRPIIRVAFAVALMTGSLNARAAVHYAYTLIDELAFADVPPSINNQGQIAFYSANSAGPGRVMHIKLWDPTAGTQVVIHGTVDAATGQVPVLNDSAAVSALMQGDGKLYRWDPIAGERPLYSETYKYFPTGINKQGVMAMTGSDAGQAVAWTGNGGQPAVVHRFDGTNVFVPGAKINDAGLVATYERDNNLTHFAVRAFENGNQLFAVSESDGYRSFTAPDVDNHGAVYFGYELPSFQGGIFRYQNGVLTEIVGQSTGHGWISPMVVTVNDVGGLAYLNDSDRIMLKVDPMENGYVLGQGDPLFGSTIQSLRIGEDSMNDAGQIAFWALLTDGRYVIGLANPVPEPGFGGLAIAALIVALPRRRRAS